MGYRETDIKLHDAVENEDVDLVWKYLSGFETELLNAWVNDDSHREFETLLRLTEQKSARAKRKLSKWSLREQLFYYLGILDGFVRIFRELFREEERDRSVITLAATQSAKTDQILLRLYTKNGGQGMRHGELADALGVSYSALTNTMKRVLQSGAVEAARTGKNTYYTLTVAGRRYCARKQEQERAFAPSQEQLIGMLTDTIQKAYQPKTRTENPLSIRPGEHVRIVENKKPIKEYYLQSIVEIMGTKYLECDEVVEANPCAENDDAQRIEPERIDLKWVYDLGIYDNINAAVV